MTLESAESSGAMSTGDYCTAKLCSGGENNCCAVAEHGMCVKGTMKNGTCQTQVQQDMYQGWGSQMPNTYLISTSGPQVGTTMGSCTVRPVSSGLDNYVGLFEMSEDAQARNQSYANYNNVYQYNSCC